MLKPKVRLNLIGAHSDVRVYDSHRRLLRLESPSGKVLETYQRGKRK